MSTPAIHPLGEINKFQRLNSFPSTNNHELIPSPALVVKVRDYPDDTMKRIAFGTYALVPIIDSIPIYIDASYHEEIANDGHNKIDDRVAAAAENINDTEPVEGEISNEDSMEGSDSTFLPNEEPTDDEDYQPDISEVDSEDFDFNLANVHEHINISKLRNQVVR